MAPLLAVPGIRWVSLQKDAAHPPGLIEDIADCQDFAATAQIVSSLDLVISIDSAIAHLAAALGRPTWVLLPAIADWRWREQGDRTPWYDAMSLLRKKAEESWPLALMRFANALADWRKHWGACRIPRSSRFFPKV